jgi:transposase-like protein
MAKRFTEAAKQAALADLKDRMTLEQASKKHKCSTASLMQWKKTLGSAKAAAKRTSAKVAGSAVVPSKQTDRLVELEDENKYLKDENQALRSLMLDGYIAKEQHPKLKQIAQTLRNAGKNQLQRIMEIILAAEAEEPAPGDGIGQPESMADSEASNGLPRHPSGMVKLRRKAEHDA